MGLWPIGLLFGVPALAVLLFGRPRPKFRGGARILWEQAFPYVARYCRLDEKNAAFADGVLTLSGLSGVETLPYAALAFEPAAIEMRVGTGERSAKESGAGILFGATYAGIGYVFRIIPQAQAAVASRIGPDWSYNLTPLAYVREIDAQPGGWNTLRIEIAAGRAQFFVNGIRAGHADYEAPMGGGMVGLHADFGDGQTAWRFSGLAVLA
jgi:hypothetical protein